MSAGTPVAVVTGGGGGIGAAIATELGRRGTYVVTVDPLVSVDGAEQLPPTDETTAGRIAAAGGRARASNASVTNGDAIRDLFAELVDEHRRLDAVVNVAGITRPTGFATGSLDDWAAVLSVHLDGYVNVLDAALPHMAAVGRGRVLGVTSGSGWRAADAGAYSCAKRAVAALTWQLGRAAPEGVAVNAISPIAMTRMVAAAMARAKGSASGRTPARSGRATGGLSLGGMPAPDELGPLGAHLLDTDGAAALRGQVLFAGGSEVALVRPPRLIDAVRTSGVGSIDHVLRGVLGAWCRAEERQATTGGANPRFAGLYAASESEPDAGAGSGRRVLVAGGGPLAAAVASALAAHGASTAPHDGDATDDLGAFDAVVVVGTGSGHVHDQDHRHGSPDDWRAVVADHRGLAARIGADARWAGAAADHVAASTRSLRLVTLIDAATAGGRSRAQAAAQLARAGRGATADRVAAFAVAVEAPDETDAAGALAAHLALRPEALGLAGAELAVGPGWIGLRSHPAPAGSLVYGGPELPVWFDAALAEMGEAP